ncbi:MAG: outer membrane beta-barrel protein [Psychroserpens sp.]|uniref:outer membrane beta-barrel protein n=1 Tax=Psychroserpens sp. TaxID=2020870 RepID=UPI003001EC23
MKSTITLFLFLSTFILSAQVNYEKGYIIDYTGKKIDCYIKNVDWSNNPSDIQYRLEENSEAITANQSTIKAFQIGSTLKYVIATVEVDQSLSQISKLSRSFGPNFQTETTFLRELVAGDASLYFYQNSNFRRFFYSIDNSEILPLVYKKYKLNNSTISENATYKKTLFDNLKCENITANSLRNVKYSQDDLVDLFSDYNVCKSGDNFVYQDKPSNGKLNVRTKLGVSFNQLEVKFDSGIIVEDLQSATFSEEIGPRFGLEVEYVLPFNKNKWSIFLEPTFLSYSSTADIRIERQVSTFEDTATIDYKVIELPLGFRHYMYLNDNSKLFINAAVVVSFDLSDDIEYRETNDLIISSGTTLLIGLGYDFNDRFSLEGRVYSNKDILSDYASYNGDLSSYGFVLGYRFL